MSAVIPELIGRLRLGDLAADGELTIAPVFGAYPGVPLFVGLEEAIGAGTLLVTEMSDGGEVPSLKAHNQGAVGVLILDGEELVGAKQNRVLNTTVYIKPGQEIVIPVSCTEAGRWSYHTHAFGDSGHLASPSIRMVASLSVTQNVRRHGAYHSDQEKVWEEVSLLQERHHHRSPTSAARDVYEQKRGDLHKREAAFPCLPGQTGLLALWSGKVAGFDLVASESVYAKLHGRLVRSYALDAPAGTAARDEASLARDRQTAVDWLSTLGESPTTEHESPGAGISYRFTGQGVVGAALAVDGAVLHAVALVTESDAKPVDDELRYPGFVERRGHFPW
jgi:hypothetical protein